MDVLENDFIDHHYPLSVLEKLKTFWLSKTLCDATLEAGPVKFYVHRLILLAAIPALTQMQICNSGKPLELILPDKIKADALNSIVHYWYTGTLHLTPQNAPWVEQIASLLGVESLYTFCRRYQNYLRQKKIVIPACELFKNPVAVLCQLERVTQLHYLESKEQLAYFQIPHSALIPTIVLGNTENVSNQEGLETKVKNDKNKIENPELSLNHSDFTLGTFPESSSKERLHFQICSVTRECDKSETSPSGSVPSQRRLASQSTTSAHEPGLPDLNDGHDNVTKSKLDSQEKIDKPHQVRILNTPDLQESSDINARKGVQCLEQSIKLEPMSDSEMESGHQGGNCLTEELVRGTINPYGAPQNLENSGDRRDSVYRVISRLVDKYMEGESESTNQLMKGRQQKEEKFVKKNQTLKCQDTTTKRMARILEEKAKAVGRNNEEIFEETYQNCIRTEQPIVIKHSKESTKQAFSCSWCSLVFPSEELFKAHVKVHLTLCLGTRSLESVMPNSSVMSQRTSTSSLENQMPNSSGKNQRASISSSGNQMPNSSAMNRRASTGSSENQTPNSSVVNLRASTSSSENQTPNSSAVNLRASIGSSENQIPNSSLKNQKASTSSTDNLTPNSSVINQRASTSSSENRTPNSSVMDRRDSTSSSGTLTPIPFVVSQTPACSTSLSGTLTPSVNQRPSTDPNSDDQRSTDVSSETWDQQIEDLSSNTEPFTAFCPLCLINFVSRKAYTAHLNICFNTFHHRQQSKFMQKEWTRQSYSLANRVPFQSSSSGRIFSFVRPVNTSSSDGCAVSSMTYTNNYLPTDDRCAANSTTYSSSSIPKENRYSGNSMTYTNSSLPMDDRHSGNCVTYTNSSLPTDDGHLVNSTTCNSSSLPMDDRHLVNSTTYVSSSLPIDVRHLVNGTTYASSSFPVNDRHLVNSTTYVSSSLPVNDRHLVNSMTYASNSLPVDDRHSVNSMTYSSSSLSADVRVAVNAGNTDTRLRLGIQGRNAGSSKEREDPLQRGNGDVNLSGNATLDQIQPFSEFPQSFIPVAEHMLLGKNTERTLPKSTEGGATENRKMAVSNKDFTLSGKAEEDAIHSMSCDTGAEGDLKIKITDVWTLKGLLDEKNVPVTASTLELGKILTNQTAEQVERNTMKEKHQNTPYNESQNSVFEVTAEGNKLYIKRKAVNGKGQSKAVNGKGQSKAVNGKGQSKALNRKGQSRAENAKDQSKAVNGKDQNKNQICGKSEVDVTRKRGRGKQAEIENRVQYQNNTGTSRRRKRKNAESATPVVSPEEKRSGKTEFVEPTVISQNRGQSTASVVITQTPIKRLTNIVAAVAQTENTFKFKRKHQGLDEEKTEDKNSTELESTAGSSNQEIEQQSSRKFYRFKNQPKGAVVHQSPVLTTQAPTLNRTGGYVKSLLLATQSPKLNQSPTQPTQLPAMYSSPVYTSPTVNFNSQMKRSSIQQKIASVYRENCIVIPKDWKDWKEELPKPEETGAPCQHTVPLKKRKQYID